MIIMSASIYMSPWAFLTWILVMPGTYVAIEPVILLSDRNASCHLLAASDDQRSQVNDLVYLSLLSFTEIPANCGGGKYLTPSGRS